MAVKVAGTRVIFLLLQWRHGGMAAWRSHARSWSRPARRSRHTPHSDKHRWASALRSSDDGWRCRIGLGVDRLGRSTAWMFRKDHTAITRTFDHIALPSRSLLNLLRRPYDGCKVLVRRWNLLIIWEKGPNDQDQRSIEPCGDAQSPAKGARVGLGFKSGLSPAVARRRLVTV